MGSCFFFEGHKQYRSAGPHCNRLCFMWPEIPGVPPERIVEDGLSYVVTDQASLQDVVFDIRVVLQTCFGMWV
jgi:hypothetical protein